MLQISKSDMHLFRTSENNRAIVFQVDTGLYFELEPIAEAVLKECDGLSVENIVSELAADYNRGDVVNTIDVLAEAGLISDASLRLIPNQLRVDERPCESPGLNTFADPFHITLHVVHACNIKCAYCFAHGGDYGGQPGLMRTDVARQAVRWAIDSAIPYQRCQIDFFGGEPLMNFELIREIVPFAREYSQDIGVDVSFGVTTNGSLMTEEVGQFLIDEEFQVKVSIDGSASVQNRLRKFHDGSDTYDVVAENVRKLAERSPNQVAVHGTMTSYDMDSEAIGRDLERLGAGHVELAPVVASPQGTLCLSRRTSPRPETGASPEEPTGIEGNSQWYS